MSAKLSIELKGVTSALDAVEQEVIQATNQALRINALQAQSALQLVTPVKTGRARGSWSISSKQGEARDSANGFMAVAAPLLPPSSTQYDVLYLTNGVPYIQDLNMGRSNQAPARFIEGTVFKYFNPKGVAVQVIP